MSKPLTTVMWPDDVARGPRDATQGGGGPWGMATNPSLHEPPRRFDGIEVKRVGRQIPQRRAACLDPRANRGLFVRLEVVHQDDVARSQMRHQGPPHPQEEARYHWCAST